MLMRMVSQVFKLPFNAGTPLTVGSGTSASSAPTGNSGDSTDDPAPNEPALTAQDYLAKIPKRQGRKSSAAALNFHVSLIIIQVCTYNKYLLIPLQHVLRNAISEADVWGLSLKHVGPAHKRHIHNKVRNRSLE